MIICRNRVSFFSIESKFCVCMFPNVIIQNSVPSVLIVQCNYTAFSTFATYRTWQQDDYSYGNTYWWWRFTYQLRVAALGHVNGQIQTWYMHVVLVVLFVVSSDISSPTITKNSSHYSDVIIGTTTSQITSRTIVCSIVCSATDQRKHHSSASLAFVRVIHRSPVNSPHKGSVMREMFPFDDVIIVSITFQQSLYIWYSGKDAMSTDAIRSFIFISEVINHLPL